MVTHVVVHHVDLADGRTATVVGYRPASATGVRMDTAALRQACGPTAQVVVLCPDGSNLTALLRAAGRCDADLPVLASAAPVTDAVKRVDGAVLTATVDRAGLSWIVGPAVVHGPFLRDLLAGWAPTTVRPLLDGGAQIAWL